MKPAAVPMNQSKADFDLPDDMIYKIMLFLPIPTLLRFRRLSKRWNNIITGSRDFAEQQMSMHSGNNKIRSCYILSMQNSAGYARLMNVKVGLPFKKYIKSNNDHHHWCGVSSSCHGLLCLIYHCNEQAVLFVWNPLTNHYKEISWPSETVTLQEAQSAFVGFGYDHIVKDYKIVVSVYIKEVQSTQVHVMTLSTKLWRSIDADPWKHLYRTKYLDSKSVFSGEGNIFWLARDHNLDNSQVWMKFNLVNERLTVIHLQTSRINGNNSDSTFCAKLCHYKGLLCYLVYETGPVPEHGYGKVLGYTSKTGERWEKVFDRSVSAPTVGRTLAEPVGFDSEGNVLMTVDDGRGLAAYLPKGNKLVNRDELGDQAEEGLHIALEMETLLSP